MVAAMVVVMVLAAGLVPVNTATAASDPTITDVSPRRGPTSGGDTIQITGPGFASATQVRFGSSTPATSFTVVSDQVIEVVVPARAPALVNVYVDTPSGTNPAKPVSWYLYLAPPEVTSVSPIKGPSTGGNDVTINGSGLLYTSQVRFGPSDQGTSQVVTVLSDTQIVARVPKLSPNLVNIWVDTPGGTNINKPSSWYQLVAPPYLAEMTPRRGPTAGGNTVVITGGNFESIAAVNFGQTCWFAVCTPLPALSFTVDSDTQITAIAPPHEAGWGCVKVESSLAFLDRGPYGLGCIYFWE